MYNFTKYGILGWAGGNKNYTNVSFTRKQCQFCTFLHQNLRKLIANRDFRLILSLHQVGKQTFGLHTRQKSRPFWKNPVFLSYETRGGKEYRRDHHEENSSYYHLSPQSNTICSIFTFGPSVTYKGHSITRNTCSYGFGVTVPFTPSSTLKPRNSP